MLRRLQHVRNPAECAQGQLPIEAEQCQRRVACVEGRLAARAGEAQRVARQRLAAHADVNMINTSLFAPSKKITPRPPPSPRLL